MLTDKGFHIADLIARLFHGQVIRPEFVYGGRTMEETQSVRSFNVSQVRGPA